MSDRASSPRSRFPVGAFEAVREYRLARWAEEKAIRRDIQLFRRRMYEVVGMNEQPTFLAAGAKYDAAACSRLTEIIRSNADPYAVEQAVQRDNAIMRWMNRGGYDLNNEGIQAAVRSQEYECYRRDREFLECIAAQDKAFEQLSHVMATTMTREHRYWEARRNLSSIGKLHDVAMEKQLEDGAVDEHDIEAALKAAGESDD